MIRPAICFLTPNFGRFITLKRSHVCVCIFCISKNLSTLTIGGATVRGLMCLCRVNYQCVTSLDRPSYKITHALLSFEFPLSDWLFLVSPADGAWAGAVWVLPFVSPMMARTSDTYKHIVLKLHQHVKLVKLFLHRIDGEVHEIPGKGGRNDIIFIIVNKN